ncbi:MAG: hypothetical protein II275_06255, partial [Bacteroidaceae bacterium]|nr:hypothetical protein [Bacteroidaceae bacterium]
STKLVKSCGLTKFFSKFVTRVNICLETERKYNIISHLRFLSRAGTQIGPGKDNKSTYIGM